MTTPPPDHPETLDPRFLAGVELLGRTGSRSFQIRYSDEDDGPPTVWTAISEYRVQHGIAYTKHWKVAAALSPVAAVMALCEAVVDGAACTHCGQMTSFVPDTDTRILDRFTCVYAWDPELSTFRRGCEGDQP